MTDPCIDFSIKRCRSCSIMSFPDIFSDEFEDFYISYAPTSSSFVTRIGKPRILTYYPAEIDTFVCECIDKIELRYASRKCLRSISDIFIIFVSDDTSCTIFVSRSNTSTIIISISVIVCKLTLILTITLIGSGVVFILIETVPICVVESCKTSPCAHATRTRVTTPTVVVPVSIVR